MAEETQEAVESTTTDETVDATETDAAAEIAKWKAEARKWEKRSKENAGAADELAKLKESQLSEVEKAQKRAKDAESELEGYKAAAERAAWNASVAKSTGIPLAAIEMLAADTEEELAEKAEALKSQFEPQSVESVPVVLGAGTNPPAPKSTQGDWIREAINNR